MVRTLGIEEELLLVDPETGVTVSGAPRVLKEFREHGRGRAGVGPATDALDHELFRHQLETHTDPTRDANDAEAQLVKARRTAGEAARQAGLAIIASGFDPLGGDRRAVTTNDRYQDMVDMFGAIGRGGGTCGMHVHVAIESEDEGVGVIDRIAAWLPVLLAVSANSPFADGRDSGYASWRSQVWARWPSAGSTEPFGSARAYHEASRFLMEAGAARDRGMLYFDARLSTGQPTVEIRVCDVCADPATAVVIAVLVRALVETEAQHWSQGQPVDGWRSEALRAAHWRAARFGLSDTLVHPIERMRQPASVVLDALLDHVRPALEEAGDLERATAGLHRAVGEAGATRQRAAYERAGTVEGVVEDLIRRTEATWAAQDLL
jgi:glutamate---cysteine ligase / carboxylate-amine ligase